MANRKTRITVDLDEGLTKRLNSITESTGYTRADVFRNSLRLYEWFLEKVNEGNNLYIAPKDAPEKLTKVELLN